MSGGAAQGRASRGATLAAYEGADLEAARTRANRLLVSGVALGSTGHIAAATVATVAAAELLDGAALAGSANTAMVVGAAVGTSLLSALMVRRGRRIGLSAGLATAVIGALVAAVAVIQGSFPLLLAGSLLLGFGNSSGQLSRYAAADMAPAARRARAIGFVVWAATIGAIVGPNIVPLAASASAAIGLPDLAGPFLMPVVFAGAAAALLFWKLRPDPYALADEEADPGNAETRPRRPMREILRAPRVVVAVTALMVGQVVMVVIMTMTPLHMTEHGHGLFAVGIVISGHTAGMFAFSPVSGWVTQHVGHVRAILAGVGVLAVASLLAATAPADGGAVLFAALFLLGYGWNLCFVAGSALLTVDVEPEARTQTEGFADSLVWSSSAAASLLSGIVLSIAGYAALGVIGMALVSLPILAILRLRSSGPGLPETAR